MFLGPGSEFNNELRVLRDALRDLLVEHEIFDAMELGNPAEVLVWLSLRR